MPLTPSPGRTVVDFTTALHAGANVVESVRTIADLAEVFADEEARRALPAGRLVYRVQVYAPVPEGTTGGLFWGSTVVEPGRVGDEYFITKGHFHAVRDRGEYYITVAGEGALILMDETRRTWYEPIHPGTVHYIPGRTAHRVANIGSIPLAFLACWPSDARHDYESIARDGFRARLREIEGRPVLVPDVAPA